MESLRQTLLSDDFISSSKMEAFVNVYADLVSTFLVVR